jgi:hypothetical protein
MSYKIIVARYNENIDWLNSEFKNCIIYNKGNKLNIDNEIMLDNVGRESDTYLNYIITNYNNLPDIIVFTQAKISDHRGSDDVNYLINLKNNAIEYSKSQSYSTCYATNQNSWCDKDWNYKNGNYYLENNYKDNKPIIFIDWFIRYIDNNYPNPIFIYTNGIFAIKKELILKRSLDYYKELINQINHHNDPAEGHFFERSWYYIFN